MGHKDLRLGQIVCILVFYNISFSWFFHRTVSNLIFCCVTVKTIYTVFIRLTALVASHAGVFREEIRAPLKTPAWEATALGAY